MLQRETFEAGVVFYVSPLLARIGVPHAFSTRVGGVSEAPFDSLNLGNPSGCGTQDSNEHLEENYRRLQGAIGVEKRRRCWVHQVHGNAVLDADAAHFGSGQKADALISCDPSKVLSVRTADCVPILLAREDGRTVAAVHAGWRGVVGGALAAAIGGFGGSGGGLVAAIGPCIGFDAFEVGDEVLDAFVAAFGRAAPIRRAGNGKGHVDLRQACRMQLRSAGVPAERIDVSDRCSFRDRDEFFSHRRDHGITGRMAALIGPASPAEVR